MLCAKKVKQVKKTLKSNYKLKKHYEKSTFNYISFDHL